MRAQALAIATASCAACTADAGFDPPFDAVTSVTDGNADSGDVPETSDGSTGAGSSTSGGGDVTGDTTSASEDDAGALCGDGIVSGNEECDCAGSLCTDEGLAGKTCLDIDDPLAGLLTGGTLGCNPASCRYDTSGCSQCGDGEVNGNEECDGELVEAVTCRELGRGTFGTVSCGSDCTLDASACSACGYAFDFSSCDQGWTTGRTDPSAANPSWECGDPTGDPPYGPPGNVTGVWATRIDGYYSANESSFLRSPPLDFSQCAGEQLTVTLTHWFNFESLATNADGAIVQASADGTTWTTLTPSGGTAYGTNPIVAAFEPVNGSFGFDGEGASDDSAAMLTTELDVSDLAGEPAAYVRFVFGSNSSSVTAGWYLDGLEILGGG